jgi:hypothetical protein
MYLNCGGKKEGKGWWWEGSPSFERSSTTLIVRSAVG